MARRISLPFAGGLNAMPAARLRNSGPSASSLTMCASGRPCRIGDGVGAAGSAAAAGTGGGPPSVIDANAHEHMHASLLRFIIACLGESPVVRKTTGDSTESSSRAVLRAFVMLRYSEASGRLFADG